MFFLMDDTVGRTPTTTVRTVALGLEGVMGRRVEDNR